MLRCVSGQPPHATQIERGGMTATRFRRYPIVCQTLPLPDRLPISHLSLLHQRLVNWVYDVATTFSQNLIIREYPA